MAGFGKLFVFEGPDGSGKTTLSRGLAHHLAACGLKCEWFSFPGQEPGTLGKHVYDIHHQLRGSGPRSLNPTSLQLLHIAAHIDAIENRILPALQQGRHAVLDRFWWSTMAYGLVAGADRPSLEAMIGIERMHWRKVRPSHLFLVRRRAPPKGEPDLEGISVAREYANLARIEASKYPVSFIDNDADLGSALEKIVQLSQSGSPVVSFPRQIQAASGMGGRNPPLQNESAKSSRVWSKLSEPKPTIVYDTYWRFAVERQAIFFRKLRCPVPPWTRDPILVQHKFTNAYRASDRVSQYLIREVAYAGDQSPQELFFRIVLFKIFNKIETWQLLTRELGTIRHAEYRFEDYDRVLTGALAAGESIYSAAYIMASGRSAFGSEKKHRNHLRLVEKMMRDELPQRIAEAKTMNHVYERLLSYPSLGPFLAYQYATDLNYSKLTDFSEMEFVVPGPGARDGLRKCFTDFAGLSEADLIRRACDLQRTECEKAGIVFPTLWGRPLQLIDCQNLFCEVGKYARIAHPDIAGLSGRTRIKQKYRATQEPLVLCYPPKWGLDEFIRKGVPDVPDL